MGSEMCIRDRFSCEQCQTVDALSGSYISFVEEEDFLADPNKYINNAYDKSEYDGYGYELVRSR